MKLKKIVFFWIFILLILGACTYYLSEILLPFILGFILAYILNPLTCFLQKHHCSRTLATTLVSVALVLLALVSLLILIPVLEAQIISFAEKLPNLANSLWLRIQPIFELIKNHISENQLSHLKESLSNQTTYLVRNSANALINVFTGWSALFNLVSLLIITPVVAFYFLLDWETMITKTKNLYPRKYLPFLEEKTQQIDETLSAFIRGQSIVCVFLALFYGFGLSVIGLDFGFSIGFISGLFSFIPYVGSLTGFFLSLLLAFTQSADWALFIGILAVFGIGQFLEGYVLTPKLVGDKVGLHPVWVIFALLAGGYLFGFMGILLAVPTFAVLGVLTKTALSYYKKSSFYKGTSSK